MGERTIIELLDKDSEATLTELMRRHVRESAEWRACLLERLDAQDTKMDSHSTQLATLTARVDRTAETCGEIESAVKAGKLMKAVLQWVSGVVVACASLWWVFKQAISSGPPNIPPGIGPQ